MLVTLLILVLIQAVLQVVSKAAEAAEVAVPSNFPKVWYNKEKFMELLC